MEAAKEQSDERERAFTRLVETYQTSLRRMCYAILRDEDQAQDAVQETFLKAYTTMEAFRGECSEKTWLMRIAINTCRDYRRSGWFRYHDRRVSLDSLPLSAQAAGEEQAELMLSIMNLPQPFKEVILLHYYQRMTTREIAQALHVSQTTVASRLNRARAKLRALLEGGNPL